jgi:hypothetical protein
MHPTPKSKLQKIPLTSAVVHDAPRQKTARDLLRALERDLAHRDLKPENVILRVPRFARNRY